MTSYYTEDVKRYMRAYHDLLNLSGGFDDEIRRAFNSARNIPEELRDEEFREKLSFLESKFPEWLGN